MLTWLFWGTAALVGLGAAFTLGYVLYPMLNAPRSESGYKREIEILTRQLGECRQDRFALLCLTRQYQKEKDALSS